MSEERGARSEDRAARNAAGIADSGTMLTARMRWSIYLLLIAIAVGNMTGRLLSVNSVDKVQLEATRIREALDRQRARLIKDGFSGKQLESQMDADEARLRHELQLQRPFLSANDRSRWLTIR